MVRNNVSLVVSEADRVFGQPGFFSNIANNGGLSATSLNNPSSVAVDAWGNLYVADQSNQRVLEFDIPLASGFAADRVFSQPGFTTNTVNNGGISAASLLSPLSVALNDRGDLFVEGTTNNRVLEYDFPLSSSVADRVFGQPDFISNTGGLSTNRFLFPTGVALDSQSNLFVVDSGYNRILE